MEAPALEAYAFVYLVILIERYNNSKRCTKLKNDKEHLPEGRTKIKMQWQKSARYAVTRGVNTQAKRTTRFEPNQTFSKASRIGFTDREAYSHMVFSE